MPARPLGRATPTTVIGAAATALLALALTLLVRADAHPPRAVAAAEASVTAPAPAPGFTLAELTAGTVEPARYDAFWSAELAAIHDSPCPQTEASGMEVTLFVGADEAWHQRLAAAIAARAAECATDHDAA